MRAPSIMVVTSLLACALPFVLHSCKKDASSSSTKSSSTIPSCDFEVSYAGKCFAYKGDVISCSPIGTVPAGTTFLWNFGDGTSSSTVSNPEHIYNSAGAYTIALTVNNKPAYATSKPVEVLDTRGSQYTYSMVGSRRWKATGHGTLTEFNAYYYSGADTTIHTTFGIEVVDSGILKIPFLGDVLLNLTQIDTVDKVLKFAECSGVIAISYYYAKDSIVYRNYWTEGKQHESLIMHTY